MDKEEEVKKTEITMRWIFLIQILSELQGG